jgi:SNF2 family DNA or RNA helicase
MQNEVVIEKRPSLAFMSNGLFISDLFFNLYYHTYQNVDKKNLDFLALRFSRSLFDMGYDIKTRDIIDDFNRRL